MSQAFPFLPSALFTSDPSQKSPVQILQESYLLFEAGLELSTCLFGAKTVVCHPAWLSMASDLYCEKHLPEPHEEEPIPIPEKLL